MSFLHPLGVARFFAHGNAYNAGRRWIERRTSAIENGIPNDVVLHNEITISADLTVGEPTPSTEPGTLRPPISIKLRTERP
jgi:hypothetical protein